MNYTKQLQEQGYFVIEKAIPETACTAMLGYMISSFSQTQTDFILEPDFRVHLPLALTSLVEKSLTQVMTPAYETVDQFLQGKQRLVELSSITVFPYAQAQNLHPDEQNQGNYLISVFVNLAPTTKESGALRIVPGSHKQPQQDFSKANPEILELPMGSAVFMNSKTWHGGGSNQTQDRIRPVFYFSFGDPDLEGPTYSIQPEVYQLEKTLTDFQGTNLQPTMTWTPTSKPRLPDHTLIVAPLNFEQTPTFLLVSNSTITKRVVLSPDTPWVQATIALVTQESGRHTLADIQQKMGVDMEWLLAFFQYYGDEGWFCCD